MSAWTVLSTEGGNRHCSLLAHSKHNAASGRTSRRLGGDFGAAPHTLPVGAIRNSCQGSLYRGDLTRDERSLPFERNVILHLDRLFGGIGIKRFGQIPCNPILPSFEFGELRLETGFGG